MADNFMLAASLVLVGGVIVWGVGFGFRAPRPRGFGKAKN